MSAHACTHATSRAYANENRSSRSSPICFTSSRSARCVCTHVYWCLFGCVFIYQLIALKQNLGDITVPAQPSLQRIHSHDSELAHTVKRLRAGILLHECIDGRMRGSSGGAGEDMMFAGRERSLQKAWEEEEVLSCVCLCVCVCVCARAPACVLCGVALCNVNICMNMYTRAGTRASAHTSSACKSICCFACLHAFKRVRACCVYV